MKKYRFIIFILGVLGMASCKDDFLERAPITSLSDANYWKTENDLKIYANNFYNQVTLLPTYQATWFSQGPYGEDALSGSDTYCSLDYNRRMNGENVLPASGGGWSASDWSVLRNINYFIDHYQSVNAPWDNVKQYVGEALFFRSIFYFNKLRRFGDLPWASTVVAIDSDQLFSSRLPRNQVADSILKDLDQAVEYLPVYNGTWTGRLTKEVALALQARVALYEGTWERYHAMKNTSFKVPGSDGTAFIQRAADAAGALIAMGDANGYPALDNVGAENGYWKLFNQKDYSSSKEVMFWRKYAVAQGLYHRWVYYTATGGSNGVTKSMVESYLCTDGKPIATSALYQGDENLKKVVANRDPRLAQTIQVDDGEHVVWYSPELLFSTPVFEGLSELKCTTGYQLYKGHTGDYAEQQNGVMSTSGLIYFRYAEILLIYAEAKTELGTITQADIDKTVNALRLRVGMNDGLLNVGSITVDPNWEFNGISPLLQEIRRERKVEMACEGFRADDIFRWAAADELIVGKKPLGAVRTQWNDYPGTTQSFQSAIAALPVNDEGYIDPYKNYSIGNTGYQFRLDRDYLYPIPTIERTLNPDLSQNPGW